MPNQFEICNSVTEAMIHLKMTGNLFEDRIVFDRMYIAIYEITFIYFVYAAFTEQWSIFTFILLLLFLAMLIYVHYEHRSNKKWVQHAEEIFLISKNNLRILKRCLEKDLLTIDIDTQTIVEISYKGAWGGRMYPSILPSCSEGTVVLHTQHGAYAVGINLNKEEAETLMTQLRSLIMQFQQPRHFIFAPHLHLEKKYQS